MIGKVIVGILILIAVCVLSFGLDVAGLEYQGWIAKRKANIERKVFKQGQTYNEGKQQELLRYMHEYMSTTNPTEKTALAFTLRHRFADYDETKVGSPELVQFLKEIKYGTSTY
jgi:hypothetical protein